MAHRVLGVDVVKHDQHELQRTLWPHGIDFVWAERGSFAEFAARHPPDAVVVTTDAVTIRGWFDENAGGVPVFTLDDARLIAERLLQLFAPAADLACSGATVSLATGIAERPEGSVALTELECALLRFLAANPTRSVPEEELLQKVWGYRSGVSSRAVTKLVYRLRRKIEADPSEPHTLRRDRGAGLRLVLGANARTPMPRPSTHPLPAPRDAFIGRVEELTRLRQLVAEARMITLVGIGGIGKSRLALALARQVTDRFESTWWVDLTACTSELDVCRSAAQTMGHRSLGSVGRTELGTYISGSGPTLLCLDRCEGVVDDVAGLVSAWLEACEELVIVATSREALRVRGEHRFFVHPLALPRTLSETDVRDSEAVQLFEARARARRPAFAVARDNAAEIAALVGLVNGIPLALELIGGRMGELDVPNQIRELERQLDLLSTDERDRPERHRSLKAALDDTFRVLGEEARRLLGELTILEGGGPIQAATEVLRGDEAVVRSGLTELINRGLVQRDDQRYRLLDVVRQHAAAWLTDEEELRERHARWFSVFRPLPAVETSNVEAACRWALAREDGPVLAGSIRMLGAIAGSMGPGSLPIAWADRALKLRLADQDRAMILVTLAQAHGRLGQLDLSLEVNREATEVADASGVAMVRAHARMTLAETLGQLGDEGESVEIAREALSFATEAGDPRRLLMARAYFGRLLREAGEWRQAMDVLSSLKSELSHEPASRIAILVDTEIAALQSAAGRYEEAESDLRCCMQLARSTGFDQGVWTSLLLLSDVTRIWRADLDQAKALALEALQLGMSLLGPSGVTLSSWRVGACCIEQDRAREAVEYLEGSLNGLAFTKSFTHASGLLALAYARLGHTAAALASLERAEHYLERGLDAELRGIVSCMGARTLVVLGRHHDAERLLSTIEVEARPHPMAIVRHQAARVRCELVDAQKAHGRDLRGRPEVPRSPKGEPAAPGQHRKRPN